MTWWTVLKQVPWTEVAVAAPGVVRTAKELLRKSRRSAPPAGSAPPTVSSEADAVTLASHVTALQQRVALLEEELQASASLIERLAEQQARTAEAISTLQTRNRLLGAACMLLAVGVVTLMLISMRAIS